MSGSVEVVFLVGLSDKTMKIIEYFPFGLGNYMKCQKLNYLNIETPEPWDARNDLEMTLETHAFVF